MVGLFALHAQHGVHRRVHIIQFNLPFGQGALDGHPFLDGASRVNHIGDVRELLTIVGIGMFLYDLALVNMFFQAKQYLTWIDGLDQVVSYFLTDSLLHDMLFL